MLELDFLNGPLYDAVWGQEIRISNDMIDSRHATMKLYKRGKKKDTGYVSFLKGMRCVVVSHCIHRGSYLVKGKEVYINLELPQFYK